MGVKHLWDIIDEAKSRNNLDYLHGKVVAVDLSIWIVEALKTLQFKTSILKPHLRNIFFRILCLRRLGIKLIFVTEGEAPDLKQETMKQRSQTRYGVKANAKKKVGRSRFQRTINECCQLLDLLGIPYVQAAGEAEAMCAVLNKHGYADGCLTNDGDFFLYGGQVVYRDFGIDPKDPHIIVYKMENIKSRLRINQIDMVGLALVCGCDYTKGVTGVGKRMVTKWLEEKSFTEDLISRFKKWLNHNLSDGISKTEATIARKALKCENFFNQKIIDEYLIEKDGLINIRKKLRWKYPNIKGLQEFLLANLEWPFEYTLNKVLQLSSSTYLEKLSDETFYSVPITPLHVVKTRCQQGVSLVEIEWKYEINENLTYSRRWDNYPQTFITLENQQVVLKVLPEMVELFLKIKEDKKKVSKKSKSSKKSTIAKKIDNDVKIIGGISKPPMNSHVTRTLNTEDNETEDVNKLCDLFTKLTPCGEMGNDLAILENSCNYQSNSSELDDSYLPLCERLARKLAQKHSNVELAQSGNFNNVINKKYADNKIHEREIDTSVDNYTHVDEDTIRLCSNGQSVDNKIDKDDVSLRFIDHIVHKKEIENEVLLCSNDQRVDGINVRFSTTHQLPDTPKKYNSCFASSTPSIANKNVTDVKYASTTDLPNFSGFGDSILCDSLELFDHTVEDREKILFAQDIRDTVLPVSSVPKNDVTSEKLIHKNAETYENVLRRKMNISLTNTNHSHEDLNTPDLSLGETSDFSLNDTSTTSDVAGSPLCLADRLKLRTFTNK